jgi:hypothetical protein
MGRGFNYTNIIGPKSMTTPDFIGKLETRVLGRDNRNLTPKEKKLLYQLSLDLAKDEKITLLAIASRVSK